MRSLRANSIGAKILLRSIAVALVPLGILAGVVFVGLNQLGTDAARRVDESREALESESVLVTSQDQAVSVAREIDIVLAERINDVQDWARNREVVQGAATAGTFATDEGLTELSIEDLEARFAVSKNTQQALSARAFIFNELTNSEYFAEVFFTDANGFNAAITNKTSDFVQSDEEWWQTAWTEGINIDDIEFDESSGVFSVDIAVRIDDPASGQRVGVLKATLDARFVSEIASDRATDTTQYTIALADGKLIAETEQDDPTRLMVADLDAGNDGLTTAIAEVGAGGLITEETVYGYARTVDPQFFDESLKGFEGFDWIVVSAQSADSAFAPIRGLEDLKAEIDASEESLRTTVIAVLAAALLLSFVMARFMARGITGPIRKLTEAASRAADTGLPRAVDRINAEGANIDSVSVPEVTISTGDELEDLANSFNSVQGTAINLAAKQALSRRNTAEMFVNLGRRNQSLLKRQLRFIDDLEKNEADPDTLDSLFKLDHLATRMRRNAESLLVLAGDRSPRRWAAPIAVRDGVQAALAEVEGYERVDFSRIEEGEIQGNVAADVAHILAELIENSLNFSPPQSEVTIVGRQETDGYTLVISDEGLGMNAEDLAAANARLSSVLELSEVPAQYLGLFVVGRLAMRHGVSVTLASAATGGLAARVVLPKILTETAPTAPIDTPIGTPVLPDTSGHVASDDPEIAEAEAEVFALLAQAEEALAKIEDAKKRRAEQGTPVAGSNPAAEALQFTDQPSADRPSTEAAFEAATFDAATFDAGSASPVTSSTESSSDTEASPLPDANPADIVSFGDVATPIIDGDAGLQPSRRAEDQTGHPTPEEAVEVGGFSFARRGSALPPERSAVTSPARRADDVAAADRSEQSNSETVDSAADPNGPDLSPFGFTRREAKAPGASPEATAAAPEAVTTLTEQEVMVNAEHSRNRWSRFQRGKEDALTTDANVETSTHPPSNES